eukprot:Tamp_16638.p1 GENE.Tamp_16638~~Tamp_16638.p1  ORF type:complete len:335 (+),score=51.77 Tamp_16638:59-1006(+)
MNTNDTSYGDSPLQGFFDGLSSTFQGIFHCDKNETAQTANQSGGHANVRGITRMDTDDTSGGDGPLQKCREPVEEAGRSGGSWRASSTGLTPPAYGLPPPACAPRERAGGESGSFTGGLPKLYNKTIEYNHDFQINHDRYEHDLHNVESLLAAIKHHEDEIKKLKQHKRDDHANSPRHGDSVSAVLHMLSANDEKIKHHEKQVGILRGQLHQKRLLAQDEHQKSVYAGAHTITHGSEMDLKHAKQQVAVFAGGSFNGNYHRPPGQDTGNLDAAHHHHHNQGSFADRTANLDAAHYHHNHHHHHNQNRLDNGQQAR